MIGSGHVFQQWNCIKDLPVIVFQVNIKFKLCHIVLSEYRALNDFNFKYGDKKPLMASCKIYVLVNKEKVH